VVVTATNSQTLCEFVHDTRSCDDMEVVRAYADAAREMARWVRDHESGWLELAESPVDAERIIRDNRLAVVLGMEVDTPFGCGINDPPTCNEADMLRSLDEVVAMGFRQITPIHLVDDGFGGSAMYDERLSVNHSYLRGYDRPPRECSNEGVSWRVRGASPVLWSWPLTFLHKGRV